MNAMRIRDALLAAGLAICTLTATGAAASDWGSLLDQAKKAVGSGGSTSSVTQAALGNDEIVAGLKEALAKGAESAIGSLGRTNGYLGNPNVKIPLPSSLQKVASALRMLGQQRYADEFVTTMNRAAESAVPVAKPIVGDAIRQMTVQDARNILNGPDDAATQYFRKVGSERLTEKMLPIVSEATARTGVTAAYKNLLARAGPAAGLLGQSFDVDRYVTGKALDGLFFMIAAEEKRIRENPLARSTDLLKKVFGSLGH